MPMPKAVTKESSGAGQTEVNVDIVEIAGTAITSNAETMIHTLTHPETEKQQLVVEFANRHAEHLSAFYDSMFMKDLFALFGRAAEYARDSRISAEFLRTYLEEIAVVMAILGPTLDEAMNPRLCEAG